MYTSLPVPFLLRILTVITVIRHRWAPLQSKKGNKYIFELSIPRTEYVYRPLFLMQLIAQEQGQSPRQGNKYFPFHKLKLIAYTPLCPLPFSRPLIQDMFHCVSLLLLICITDCQLRHYLLFRRHQLHYQFRA